MAIHIDILARLDQRNVRNEADKLADQFERVGTRIEKDLGDHVGKGVTRGSVAAERALNRVNDAQERINRLKQEYLDLQGRSDVDDNRIIASKNRIINAERALAKAARDSALAQRVAAQEAVRGSRALDSAARGASVGLRRMRNDSEGLSETLINLGRQVGYSARGLGVLAAAPVGIVLLDTAKAAVTASQSIFLLPAAATAAATGIGTLKLATMGFGDAMDNIGDPEKFAEALAKLSPNAQQAALSIRAILPELKGLQQATQDAFFFDIGPMVEQIEGMYLPTIEKLTTSVATSFNTMIHNVATQLMSPEVQASVSTVVANISQTFKNLEPAATAISSAFIDLTATGSSFLPGLATDISNAAQQFANFISEARQSGDLARWIREGIDAVKELGDAIWMIGTFIYDVFGSDGQQNINDFKDTLQGVQTVLDALNGNFGEFNQNASESPGFLADIRQEVDLLTGKAAELRDTIYNLPGALRAAENGFIDFANNVTDILNKGPIAAFNNLMENITRTLNMLPGADKDLNYGKIPEIPKMDHLPDEPWKNWNTLPENTPGGQFSNNNYSGPVDPTSAKPQEWINPKTGEKFVPGPQGGWIPESQAQKPGTPGGPYAVPAPPPTDANGKKLTDKQIRDQIAAGLDPNSYKVDPYAPVAGLPVAGSLGKVPGVGGPMPGGGFGSVNQQDLLEAQHRVESEARDLEDARRDRLTLEKDNTATAREIDDAKWKETEAGWALQKAQADLVDKQRGTTRDLKNGMDDLSAALDPDLGLSKGLAGLADNLVRFLGNVAMAPVMGKLQGIVNADPIKGGYGALGILGAQNIAKGLSPLLGQPYGDGTTGTPASGLAGLLGGAGATGTSAGTGAIGSARPGESDRDFAHRVMMPFFQNEGLTVGDHSADKYGEHQNGALDIMVKDLAEGNKVLQQVLSDPNVYGAIFDNQTYGYGHGTTPRDYSAGHTGDPSQDHTNHVHAFYKPGGQNNILPPGTGQAPSGTYGGASATMPQGGGGSGFNWDAVAAKESSGNWSNNDTGGNGHYGGLQFSPSTWKAYGGQGMPNEATPEMQKMIADRTAFTGWNGTPPQGLGAWEVITNGSTAADGITTSSLPPIPAGAGGQGYMGLGGPKLAPNIGPGPLQPDPGGIAGLDPNSPVGLGGAPGGVGPFPTSPGVSGGLGNMANASLGGSYGGAGTSGWSPSGNASGGGTAPGGGPTRIGGTEPFSNPAGGNMGITPGGSIDTALSIASTGLDAIAPGAGQAAQIGIKEGSRAIQYAGQVAAITAGGLMETLLPTGGSELANNSWLTRIAGGLAGASPAIPNVAGGKAGEAQQKGEQPPGPLTPQQVQEHGQGTGNGNQPGPAQPINVEYNAYNQTEDANGKHLSDRLGSVAAAPMGGMGKGR